MILLDRVGREDQKDKWLQPIIDGKMRSSIVMTEPAPGSGSDPTMMLTRAERKGNDKWVINGRKWFITGAEGAEHFILLARTSDDKRRSLTTFLFHKDQPGWNIIRRIPIMGPEEHGGHCEIEFDGLEIKDEDRLMEVGDGLKLTQIRLGTARLTHCMRWLGLAKRSMEIAIDYAETREGFGIKLADRESVQSMLGELAHNIEIGRLLVMKAAWKLAAGDFARKEVSMAKIHVADTLHAAVDTAMRLGYNHPMGPLELADLVGLDARLNNLRSVTDRMGRHEFAPPPLLVDLVEAGHLGRKTGRGFYAYDTDGNIVNGPRHG